MSWLKEIEDSVESKRRKIQEAEEAKRLAEERDYERRKREWEKEGLGLLERWREWNCDELLENLRDLLWPNSEITAKRIGVRSTKGEFIYIYEKEKVIELRGSFGFKKTTKNIKTWNYYDCDREIEIDDITEFLNQRRIGPRDVEDFTVSRNVWHTMISEGLERQVYGKKSDFILRLHRDCVFVGRAVGDDVYSLREEGITLEGITNSARLQDGILQHLKTRPDLKDRLNISITQPESS